MMKHRKAVRCLTAACLAGALMLQPVLAAAPSIPQGWTNPFRDVPQTEWFTPFIANLHANGIVSGYNAYTFGPRDNAMNDQAALMIVKAAGSGVLELRPGDHWSAPYVRYAQERGWYLDGEFPADMGGAAKRGVVGHMAAKALHLPIDKNAPSPFADVKNDPYLTALYKADIMVGVQQGKERNFLPNDTLTRAELSTVVWKIMEYRKHIHYRDRVLDILPNVPAARYDRDLFRMKNGRMGYADPSMEAVLGVDVSHNQSGTIDWGRVAKDNIQFALLRVGGRGYGVDTGRIYQDRKFDENLQGAQEAGLDVGVYFFSQAITVDEAREEAQFVLDRLKTEEIQGPVVFDWEHIPHDEARTDHVDSKTLTAMAKAFCQEVEKAGYDAMIYSNRDLAYLEYDLSQLTDYPIWLAEYSDSPSFYYDYAVWQYSERGSVDGISGNVDMNVFLRPVKA